MAKKLGERNKIIREIVQTEETYCNCLEELVKVIFFHVLKQFLALY
jgi:hypothetical protein